MSEAELTSDTQSEEPSLARNPVRKSSAHQNRPLSRAKPYRAPQKSAPLRAKCFCVFPWLTRLTSLCCCEQGKTMASQTGLQPSSSSSPASVASHRHVMRGCSPISKYELLEKLGEGTFGYIP